MITTHQRSETLAERKSRMNALLSKLPRWGEGEPIAFFCECADESCYQAVWLTCREYDLGRTRSGRAAVIDGHPTQASLG